ncbi:MAG TPA: DUF302 domain-containing protein [Lutibacter sp.]|nr:DUF302 domain-containing protein [Lutibacter sp.]
MKTKLLLSFLLIVVFLSSCNSTKTITSNAKVQLSNQMDSNGIVTKPSFVNVKTTMDRLEKIISKTKGISLFNRINHAENSRNAGAINVVDTEVIIFGNPKVGLKMLEKDPKAGLDLPLKIVAYQAKDGKVYVSYRSVSFYGNIYNLGECEAKNIMNNKLNKISDIITKSPQDFKTFMAKKNSK